jgi:hypothetical protein
MFKATGLVVVGIVLIGFVFPAHFVSASSDWIQSSVSDFNSDTLTNMEIHYVSWDTSNAYVHLVDNSAETHSSQQTVDSRIAIDTSNLFSCAFHPTFNALCDQIDLQIYVVGNPVDNYGNQAILSIALFTANAIGIHQPQNSVIYTDPNTRQNYPVYKEYDLSSLPTQSGSWISLYLTETDSFRNVVEPSQLQGNNQYYAIVVGCNAVVDANNAVYWEYKQNSQSQAITTDINHGQGWGRFMSQNNIPQDPNVVIHWHDFVHTGNLVSIVFDTGQMSQFTWFNAFVLDMPAGTVPTFYVRTGNSPNTNDPSWSAWTLQSNNAQWNNVCPSGRYVQYKFVITAGNDPLQIDAFTGAVKSVDITYS